MAVEAPYDQGCRTGHGHCPIIRVRSIQHHGNFANLTWSPTSRRKKWRAKRGQTNYSKKSLRLLFPFFTPSRKLIFFRNPRQRILLPNSLHLFSLLLSNISRLMSRSHDFVGWTEVYRSKVCGTHDKSEVAFFHGVHDLSMFSWRSLFPFSAEEKLPQYIRNVGSIGSQLAVRWAGLPRKNLILREPSAFPVLLSLGELPLPFLTMKYAMHGLKVQCSLNIPEWQR